MESSGFGRFEAAEATKTNVRFIIVDNLTTTLRRHGDKRVRTPRMDALAARSMNGVEQHYLSDTATAFAVLALNACN